MKYIAKLRITREVDGIELEGEGSADAQRMLPEKVKLAEGEVITSCSVRPAPKEPNDSKSKS